MATYAIGDIHGCYYTLMRLLEKIQLTDDDTLWLCGDLVNRGRYSLDVLRFAYKNRYRYHCVLGNHDLMLISSYYGCQYSRRTVDALRPVFVATDAAELVEWLSCQPFMLVDDQKKWLLAHAGLPSWGWETIQLRHRWLVQQMRDRDWRERFFKGFLIGNNPMRWDDTGLPFERARLLVNCFTRIRYVKRDGTADFSYKGDPHTAPRNIYPWFERRSGQLRQWNIVFGHWSTLHPDDVADPMIHNIDSGCAWGGSLTAVCTDGAAGLHAAGEKIIVAACRKDF